MNFDEALKLAENKLNWQVKKNFRKGYTYEDLQEYAYQIFLMSNSCKGVKE